ASARKVPLANVVLAAFVAVLGKLTRQRDIGVGMAVAGRTHADLENLVGFFINTVILRVQLDDDWELEDLISEVAGAVQGALEHQDYPFDRLVQTLNPDRTAARQPLFNVMFSYQSFLDV